MSYRTILAGLLAAAVACYARAADEAQGLTFLDNGVIKLGVDLDHGGSIAFLAERNGNSVINVHDLGRYVRQSYYAGPRPFGKPHPAWKDWPWNPVSAGNVYGISSREVFVRQTDRKTLYVKSTPMQWALNNVPADCTFETWITLDGRTAHVRNRLTNQRHDRRAYEAMDQELPAVYTVGTLHRLMTYDGDKPFSNAPVREIPKTATKGGKARWTPFIATEHWAALVNDADWGLGVFHAGAYRFLGGFYGKPGPGGPKDDATGYIAPVRREVLDHDIAYEYHYTLVLDSLEQIRRYAYKSRPSHLPDYRFDKDRQHWWLVNATDQWPVRDRWRVTLEKDDPQLIGPDCFWDAAEVPKLYVRAAYKTRQRVGEVLWKTREQPEFSRDRRVQFPIQADGKLHTYEVDLAGSPAYRGKVTWLRFDPVAAGAAGEWVEIDRISYRKPSS